MMMPQSATSSSDKRIQDLLATRNYSEAERLIRERLVREPQSADGHYLLGVCHYFQGDLANTVSELRKSLELDPRHTDAAICLSVLFNDIGRYDDAKKIFEQANQSVVHKRQGDDLAIDRKFAVKHMELADLYFRYRRYDQAIEEYGKAAVLDPAALEIRIRRAKAYAKKGFLSRAIQELQQLKAEQPAFLTARIQLGLLYYSQGNLLDAELEWESVSEQDPSNREAMSYLDMIRRTRP